MIYYKNTLKMIYNKNAMEFCNIKRLSNDDVIFPPHHLLGDDRL